MFLSGCMLTKPTKPPYTVYNGTRDLLYKNIEVAIHYLGYPNNTLTVGDNEVYEWKYEHSYTKIKKENKVAVDRVPVRYGNFLTTQPVSYIKEVQTPIQINDFGLIRLIVNKQNYIINTEIQGTNNGLKPFADKLLKYTRTLNGNDDWSLRYNKRLKEWEAKQEAKLNKDN